MIQNMYRRLKCVMLLSLLLSWTYAQTTNNPSGVCEKKPLKCCINYRRVADRCEECWPGSYSYNCNSTCPDGFYGKFCREKCNCSACDKMSGCTQNSSSLEPSQTTDQVSADPQNAKDLDWHIVAIFISGSSGLCFIFGYAVYRKLRKHRCKKKSNSRGNNDSNRPLQSNPYASYTSSGENFKNLSTSRDLKPHFSSKCHERTEALLSDTSLPASKSQNALNVTNTSENVYSHLNMDTLTYNTLNHTSESENESNIGMYSSSQKGISTDNNFYNKSVTSCRQSFLYPEKELPKDEYSSKNDEKVQKDISSLDNVSEAARSNIIKSDGLTASVTRKVKLPSKRERLEKKIHMDEMSKLLENFKPKTEEVENNNSKASIIHRQRSSKKTKKKLLKYTFAPSTEIV